MPIIKYGDNQNIEVDDKFFQWLSNNRQIEFGMVGGGAGVPTTWTDLSGMLSKATSFVGELLPSKQTFVDAGNNLVQAGITAAGEGAKVAKEVGTSVITDVTNLLKDTQQSQQGQSFQNYNKTGKFQEMSSTGGGYSLTSDYAPETISMSDTSISQNQAGGFTRKLNKPTILDSTQSETSVSSIKSRHSKRGGSKSSKLSKLSETSTTSQSSYSMQDGGAKYVLNGDSTTSDSNNTQLDNVLLTDTSPDMNRNQDGGGRCKNCNTRHLGMCHSGGGTRGSINDFSTINSFELSNDSTVGYSDILNTETELFSATSARSVKSVRPTKINLNLK